MNEYLTHKTRAGDRWDLLAMEYYGNAFATEFLLDANPGLAALAILPAGLALKVPLVDAADINPQQEGVVPWR
jgi:phage tail protein X